MSEYQVLARKYRPQIFSEVIGQDAIVTTLKNAIRQKRLAHAYLFSGSRGTGKTTIARIFAKALNCQNPSNDMEPCCKCSSCKEIASGTSLDVLEIDGASHRGIDDIRQINETVGYATASGKYKIILIDEVHMLTKEAFNALLKTLEEPPAKVIFFFATTEPHKVLPTILSRCQRFNLHRISAEKINQKLKKIIEDLKKEAESEALDLIAHRAEGGLRDAESLLDQILSFHEGKITVETVANVLGILPREVCFEFDRAAKEGNLQFAFDIAEQIFGQGKDLTHFIETMMDHFRSLLLTKLASERQEANHSNPQTQERYRASAKLYTQEQCMTILDMLIEAENQMRFMASPKIALEALLLRIMRTHYRVPVDYLVRRLAELEACVKGGSEPPPSTKPEKEAPKTPAPLTIDPTPTSADLGKTEPPQPKPADKVEPLGAVITAAQQSRYDTILQFAAVELEATIQKQQMRG